jgi:hypothetical protein
VNTGQRPRAAPIGTAIGGIRGTSLLTKCPSTRWRYRPFLKILRHESGKEASRDAGSGYGNHVVKLKNAVLVKLNQLEGSWGFETSQGATRLFCAQICSNQNDFQAKRSEADSFGRPASLFA